MWSHKKKKFFFFLIQRSETAQSPASVGHSLVPHIFPMYLWFTSGHSRPMWGCMSMHCVNTELSTRFTIQGLKCLLETSSLSVFSLCSSKTSVQAEPALSMWNSFKPKQAFKQECLHSHGLLFHCLPHFVSDRRYLVISNTVCYQSFSGKTNVGF